MTPSETRKIQRVGTSTLTISVPKRWAARCGLEKGDPVVLEDDGEVLRITPPPAQGMPLRSLREQVVDADCCESPHLLERAIVGNYLLGRERLVIRSSRHLSAGHQREIQDAVRGLMGLGVIEESPTTVILQASIDPSKYPMDTLMRRLFALGVTMVRGAMRALVERDRELAEEAIHREEDADQMYWLILRLLLTAQREDPVREKLGMRNRMWIVGYRLISKEFESVADHAEDTARTVIHLLEAGKALPNGVTKSFYQLSEKVLEAYASGVNALLAGDFAMANAAIDLQEGFPAELAALQRRLFQEVGDAETLVHLTRILWGIERINDYAHSVAVIATNRYLEHPSNLSQPTKPAK